jgi:L-glutamine-phosphate cytidylyltransferase
VKDTRGLSLTLGESDANDTTLRRTLLSDSSIVRVIILAAGQGKRLLPLTADVPKALLDIGGKLLIERQIEAFASNGLKDFVVVTGYGADRMEAALALVARRLDVSIKTLFNPFYAVADNMASCWLARPFMTEPFIQVNGDNVFQQDLVAALLRPAKGDVNVAINRKAQYDADDMKVMMDGERLTEIGKTLPVDTVDAEAIGFYVFRGEGPLRYAAELELAMRDAQGLKRWFPSAVGSLAKKVPVNVIEITGLRWSEVDFPVDLQHARQLVSSWI